MSSPRHADRRQLVGWLPGAVAAAVALAAGAAGHAGAQGRIAPTTGAAIGVAVALLTVLGLPSLSIRLCARVVVTVSAAVLIRYGVIDGALADAGQVLVVWLIGATAAVVLTDRVGTDAVRALEPAVAPTSLRAPGPEHARPAVGGRGPASTARLVLGLSALVLMVAVLLAPVVAPHFERAVESGEGPRLSEGSDGASALRSADSLDMTTRPDLGDGVVFTVDADRATFWRAQVFDVWDGRRWSRSDGTVLPLTGGDQVVPAEDDLAAAGSDELVQRFRLEVPYSDLIFAAATPATVEAPGPVAQRPDGTLLSRPLGRGASYRVVSRRIPLTEAALRDAEGGPTPPEVLERYATPSVVSERVDEVARQVTEGLTNDYDRIRALEAWMGRQTEYSLDAPLAPTGVDVVDHFLFESKLGWCEQIASSLVVLARANGIPARLVTGYVPGERDRITGTFTVRERDAHAWAEVWFPGLGWVPFDPTADVDLAGADVPDQTVLQWLIDHAVLLLAGLAVVGLAFGPLRAWWRRRSARGRSGAAVDPTLAWAREVDGQLEALGERAGWARAPDVSAHAHATGLAPRYDDPRLVEVGRLVDDALFSPVPPAPERQAWVREVLAEAEAHGPSPQPAKPT